MNSRTKFTKNNIVTGFLYQIVSVLFPFLTRTVLLYYMGAQYVGVSTIFASILQILNLAELGFSSAIIYSMYKPIHEGDTKTICALLAYYRKVYIIVGLVFTISGLVVLPFITLLINGTWPSQINIYIVFLFYLVDMGVSYFLYGYKFALLTAFQRSDIINGIRTLVNVFRYLLEIFIIIVFRNYYMFAAVLGVSTVLNNIFVNIYTKKHYPEYVCKGKLDESIKKSIKKQVSGLLICNVGDKIRNSFDTVVLSILFGLMTVTIFGNYFYVFSAIAGVMQIITTAMQASVGNCIAAKGKEENYEQMRGFQFAFFWINCWFTTCLLCLYQPFMKIWAGENLMFPMTSVVLFCFYFYVLNSNNIRNLYFNGNGLWWSAKISFALEAIGNLVLNVILGIFFGVNGVLIATIITIVVFNFFQRTNVLFKKYYGFGQKEFLMDHFMYLIVMIFTGSVTLVCCGFVETQGMSGLLLTGFMCAFIPNIILFLAFIKTKKFRFLKSLIVQILKK